MKKENKQVKAYKVKIFPTVLQKHWIDQSIGNRRFIYNALLSKIKDNPKEEYSYIGKDNKQTVVKSYSKKALQNILVKLQNEVEFLSLSHSQSNQESAHSLSMAYSNAFNPKLKNFKEPKYKKKKFGGKFYLPCQNENIKLDVDKKTITIKPLETFIKQQHKDKLIKNDRTHFEINCKPNNSLLPNNYIIKALTIEKDSVGSYYASFIIEYELEISKVNQHIDNIQAVGIDLGVANQVIMSNNILKDIDKKHILLEQERIKIQKRLSKKIEARKLEIIKTRNNPSIPSTQFKKINKKRAKDRFKNVLKKYDRLKWNEIKKDNHFSKEEWETIYNTNNIKRLQKKVNKAYKKVANIKKDHNHKLSKMIIDNNSIIIFENLNIQGMVRNKKLSKAILDKSWGQLKSFCKYKAENQGKIYHQIDRFYPSSKICNCCEYKLEELTLKIREWTCPSCFALHDRDLNASYNILKQGLKDIGYLEEEVLSYVKKVKFHTALTEELPNNSVEVKRHSA